MSNFIQVFFTLGFSIVLLFPYSIAKSQITNDECKDEKQFQFCTKITDLIQTKAKDVSGTHFLNVLDQAAQLAQGPASSGNQKLGAICANVDPYGNTWSWGTLMSSFESIIYCIDQERKIWRVSGPKNADVFSVVFEVSGSVPPKVVKAEKLINQINPALSTTGKPFHGLRQLVDYEVQRFSKPTKMSDNFYGRLAGRDLPKNAAVPSNQPTVKQTPEVQPANKVPSSRGAGSR